MRIKRKLMSNMKSLRQEVGITQEQLAEIVGVSRQTVSYLEKGEYNPSLKIAHDIARYFEKSIDDIFTYEPVITIKRKQFNLTQEQLASLIGIDVEDLKKLENEDYTGSMELINKIAKQLNCEIEDLIE
ncbi:MAG: helix-turn-helix domain-containing protein [Candidatus Lokiarchaeota archaeon]|nr:helix-turn-helix domain-containing protein [Candidatus Lokiarchaeota archaeon]